jgi:hypothetical protein
MGFAIKTNFDEIGAEIGSYLTAEMKRGNAASLAAMNWAARETKSRWKTQIKGSGLGSRLSNTVKSNAYQNPAKPSVGAWALVWSKAPKITAAHEEGALIRSQSGTWLAIPTAAAGKGARGRKMTVRDWEKRTGRQLRFVYRKGRTALLIDEGRAAPGNVMVSRRARGGNRLGAPRTFRNRSIVIFTLVPQVKLKKKLDLIGASERVASELPARIAALWK